MYTAQEVIKDKFWIVYSNGSKIGTLRNIGQSYEFFNQSTDEKVHLDNMDELFKTAKNSYDQKEQNIVNIGGYTTGCTEIFDSVEGDIPMFKKSKNAKTFYAAGHYIVKFLGMGWQWASIPKVETLTKYQYKGPFLTEWEMQLELKKHRRGSEDACSDTDINGLHDTS